MCFVNSGRAGGAGLAAGQQPELAGVDDVAPRDLRMTVRGSR